MSRLVGILLSLSLAVAATSMLGVTAAGASTCSASSSRQIFEQDGPLGSPNIWGNRQQMYLYDNAIPANCGNGNN